MKKNEGSVANRVLILKVLYTREYYSERFLVLDALRICFVILGKILKIFGSLSNILRVYSSMRIICKKAY